MEISFIELSKVTDLAWPFRLIINNGREMLNHLDKEPNLIISEIDILIVKRLQNMEGAKEKANLDISLDSRVSANDLNDFFT